MQEAECEADLGRVEARMLLRQAALTLHVEHEVSSVHKLDDEEQPAKTRLTSEYDQRPSRTGTLILQGLPCGSLLYI